jgi:signal peptidase I
VDRVNWQDARARWRKIPPLARDLLVAVAVISLLMGSLWTYTGQPLGQAPLVVVESGSMMHADAGYGRMGTIDPGDLILVKRVPDGDPMRVVTLYGSRASGAPQQPGEGSRSGYGMAGDVIIFRQDDCRPRDQNPPPIIHRAITWVEVRGEGDARRYSYHDESGNWLTDRVSVDLPVLRGSHEFPR